MVKSNAFSLIEILLTMALFLGISMAVLPLALNQLNQNRVDASAKLLYQKIFTQEQNAYAKLDGLSYGLVFSPTNFSTFASLASDNYDNLVSYNLEPGVSISNVELNDTSEQLFFNKGSQVATTFGKIYLSDGNLTYIVEINSEGMVEYYRQ